MNHRSAQRRRLMRPVLGLTVLAVFVPGMSGGQSRPNVDVFVANLGSHAVSRFDGESGAFKGIVADSSSGLRNGTGVAFGPDGHLYVSSSGTHQILRYDGETGKLLGTFVKDTVLFRPFSLAFGPDNHLYVSSGKSNNVLRYDGTNGRYLGVAAGGEALRSPIGLAFGRDGMLYVANAGGKNVLRFDGRTGVLLGTAAKDSLTFVSDVAFGPDRMLYVSDASLRRVTRFDPATGRFLNVVVTLPEGSVPVGIAFDDAGRLWIGDFAKSQLFRLDRDARELTLLSTSGMGRPENIAIRRRR